jgi:hypothetical protein
MTNNEPPNPNGPRQRHSRAGGIGNCKKRTPNPKRKDWDFNIRTPNPKRRDWGLNIKRKSDIILDYEKNTGIYGDIYNIRDMTAR